LVFNGDPYPEGGSYSGESCEWGTLLMFVLQRNAKGIGANQDTVTAGQAGSIKEIFVCPNVFIPSIVPSARMSHYSAHPRLMPNMRDFDSWVSVATGVFRGMKPYKVTRVKRQSEIGIVFEGAIDYSTGVGAGYLAQSTCNALNRDGLGRAPLFLTDDYGRSPAANSTPNTPVDLRRFADSWTAARDLNKDSNANRGNIRFRHLKDTQTNVLMMDGHVESFKFNAQTQSTDLLHKNICVTPPQ
jgi:prepilin-type processing-associated H-X9-DG protein